MQYTSGSTGEPRGVLHRHAALSTAVTGVRELLDVRPDDVVLSASKLAFGYGLGSSVLVPMSVGASSVLVARPLDAAMVARELARHRPTLFFAVATLYAALLAGRDVAERFPLRDCRAYISSGEHLSATLGTRCLAAFGPRLVNVFGCTETLYSFAGNTPGDWSPETIGAPLSGWDLRLEPESEASGELWVRGPGVAAGYWRRPDQTGTAFAPAGCARATRCGVWTVASCTIWAATMTYSRSADSRSRRPRSRMSCWATRASPPAPSWVCRTTLD